MTIIAKARIVKTIKNSAAVQFLDTKGNPTGEKRTIRIKEGLKLKKGDIVLVSFGVAVEKLR